MVSAGLKICPISGCSFMPNFPNFLFSTMSSVLSRTSSLLSLDMGIFKDVKLDAPVSRTIGSACFWSASWDTPTPSCQQSFQFSIFTSSDVPGSSPSTVVMISSFDSNSFRFQTRSTGSPDTTKSSPCTRHVKLYWGCQSRTGEALPIEKPNVAIVS